MNTQNIVTTSALLVASIFFFAFTSTEETIKGNGNVTTQERTITPFTEVQVSGTLNVFFQQGEKENVKIGRAHV